MKNISKGITILDLINFARKNNLHLELKLKPPKGKVIKLILWNQNAKKNN